VRESKSCSGLIFQNLTKGCEMQAVILAAGMGKRLGNLTAQDTKCMLLVNGKTLIDRTLEILSDFNLSRVVIVVGFAGQRLKDYLGDSYKGLPIKYVKNPIYDQTNNIYSLYLAKDCFKEEDTLLLESDLIYEKKIIERLLNDSFPNLAAVDRYESWMDGTVVTLNDDDDILSFVPKKHFEYEAIPDYYKTVNIYKFSRKFITQSYLPFLEAYSSALGRNEYYEQVLRVLLTLEQQNLKALRLNGEKWYEIDDVQDLNNAEAIFAPPQQKLDIFKGRYGGYWRYPAVRDFCYLVNPYFPTSRMQHEMGYYFDKLLAEYPSGQNTQRLLASKMFKCRPDQILVGNGAAELIFGLFSDWRGYVGVVYPTFNEYPERMKKAEVIPFIPDNSDFSYNADDLKQFSEQVDALLLINPDNPSGNFIPKADVLDLLEFLDDRGKVLVLDESFVDFSEDGPANSLIDPEVMDRYENLVLIKSISKSYGVPGARLGVVATSNRSFLKKIGDNLSIWNINSFGEFFLQIIGKYEGDYNNACCRISEERDRFYTALKEIPYLRPIPSQANYFLCEVKAPWTATSLVQHALAEYDLFLKDCTGKVGFEGKKFIRIAVRDQKDNDGLIKVLIEI
jgi:histidinol-phosphate/aromatic aminotransferase/cobyric acid decarboxylase-like protein/choline kinase